MKDIEVRWQGEKDWQRKWLILRTNVVVLAVGG
jgi:hypothetical protein